MYYPFNEELKTLDEDKYPKNGFIAKNIFNGISYLVEFDLELMPKELSLEQKQNIIKSIYRIKTWKI